MKVAAIIPAYDAEKTLGAVLSETMRAFEGTGKVYVVDDGSRDQTAEIARRGGAIVLSHAQNRGKGCALRTGLARAAADGHVAAVTLDADGQHLPSDALRLATLGAPAEALVLGIRDLKGAGAPRPNQISNAISNGFLSLFARKRLHDTQCGLRRYPLPKALELGGRDPGYAFEAEVILLAIAAGVPIVEELTQVIYPAERITHFDSVRDPMRVIRRVLRTLVTTRYVTRPARQNPFDVAAAARSPRASQPGEDGDRASP